MNKAGLSKRHHFYKHFGWADKARGYAIQGLSRVLFVKRIDGDYYNVVDLPVGRLYREIKKIGIM